MVGIDYTSEEVITSGKFDGNTGKEAWTLFMNQLTFDEMKNHIAGGAFGTAAINGVAKKRDVAKDGPSQIKAYTEEGRYGMGYTAGIVLASTWNKELAYEYGKQIGEWGLATNVNGWYGPAINIHLSAAETSSICPRTQLLRAESLPVWYLERQARAWSHISSTLRSIRRNSSAATSANL